MRKQPPFGGCFFVYSRPLAPLHSARLLDPIFIFLFRIFHALELLMFQPHHIPALRVVRMATIAVLIGLLALPLFVSALVVLIVQAPLLLLTVLSLLIPLFPRFKEWRTQPEVLIPTWTIIGINFFFCISRTLSTHVAPSVYLVWFLLAAPLTSALCWYLYARTLRWINHRAKNRSTLQEVLTLIETAQPLFNSYQNLRQSGKTPSARMARRMTGLCEQMLDLEPEKYRRMTEHGIQIHTARRNYTLAMMVSGQPALDEQARATIYNALHAAKDILLSSPDDA